ncbi:hypothetical protein KVA01_05450 [Kocuria varians]|uniref:Uncharacterized protein n=1 Tax=Kocuria varians TaxID=1272 RepID=A0A4Y4D6I5_KOCVA|nr:hypothetical protein [Kocuria varians]GEC98390.1 hypothetical protein KVA01_05450 [Kocuria varians]
MRRIPLPETWDAREADRGFMASLATIAFLSLGLELVVAGTALTVTGAVPGLFPLGAQCLVWSGLGVAWLLVARALVAWSRRRGVDPLPAAAPVATPAAARTAAPAGVQARARTAASTRTKGLTSAGASGDGSGELLDHRPWRGMLLLFLAAVLVAFLLPGLLEDTWTMAAVERYGTLFTEYGGAAWLAMLAWTLRLLGYGAVAASVLAYSHRAVRELVDRPFARWVPWGGLVTGVLLGAVAFLAEGGAMALTTLVTYVLLGMLHVRSGESLRVTACFTVLVLAVL